MTLFTNKYDENNTSPPFTVTLESLHGGNLKSVSWNLGTHNRGTLLLTVASTRVKLFIGCRALHWHAMPTTHNLLTLLASQKLKLVSCFLS